MEMTSNCDVTNSAHQMQMTTIWPSTKHPPWKVSAYATGGRSFQVTIAFALNIFSFSDKKKVLDLSDRHYWDASCCRRM